MTRRRGSRGRGPLVLIGSALVLAGLLFAAQGSGWFPYPRSSFMVGTSPWVMRGAGLVVAGCILLAAAARIGRR